MVSLSGLRTLLGEGVPPGRGDEDSVRRQWWAALATLQEDLLVSGEDRRGVWLAAPLPALYEPALLRTLQGWVWAPAAIDGLLPASAPLLPQSPRRRADDDGDEPARATRRLGSFQRLPLRDDDGTDALLVLITPRLQVALALDGPADGRRLLARFDAGVLSAAFDLLDRRLQQDDPAGGARLRRALLDLGPLHNDPELGLRFWPLLAQRLAGMGASVTLQPLVPTRRPPRPAAAPPEAGQGAAGAPAGTDGGRGGGGELALLEAITHEVRTPLATIRTLIRSLLRRADLTPVVRQRLEQIDGECSEQIDRFGLIFLAAEQQRHAGGNQPLSASELARTDLASLLRQLEELWRRQLARRGLELELEIPDDLPPVLSDPSRLETMLGGLVDRFSRSLRAGNRVRLSLGPAGARLKLQLSSSDPQGRDSGETRPRSRSERVGPVLSWDPTTGSLQLSRRATQQLFHRLGGRLTGRGDSTLTVFFPVADTAG
ncbi:MAG: histidine kinase dimerization/phospho-acceptor domain-containing protein [Synechococcaceae cyanobacterium]|nr:histidine kinase dimerization/phospho-acceptor domain-containing protein [Synechococcaceae cyanobacterium]